MIEKVKSMKPKEVQMWLRKVDLTNLAIALLGFDEEIKKVIYANLSESGRKDIDAEVKKVKKMDAKKLVTLTNIIILESLL